jgi:hypothetical protein
MPIKVTPREMVKGRAVTKKENKKKNNGDEDIPLIKADKKPVKVPFTGGKAKEKPAVKRFATQGKRGGGMVGRNGIIKGYKKGGQV